MSVLQIPCHLDANPHWYDYIHRIDFHTDGSFIFADGAGHAFNGTARGEVLVCEASLTTADIRFMNIEEFAPYSREKIKDLNELTVRVTRERGTFMLREEAFGIHDPYKQPYLVYPTRFIFNSDPLMFAHEYQKYNLFHLMEKRDFVNSVRTFYNRGEEQRLTLGQLVIRGFNVNSLMPGPISP